jgi:uncharacterized protein
MRHHLFNTVMIKPFLSLLLIAGLAGPAFAADQPARKYKMLVMTQSKGFVHEVVRRPAPDQLCLVERVMIELGEKSGLFEAECSQDASIITPEKLKDLDILFLYTTGSLPISPENWKAIMDWVASGKAVVGIHSATDTAGPRVAGLPTYTQVINGRFAGHPWNQGTPIVVTSHEPYHPAVKVWGGEFDYKEEIYQYQDYDPSAVRVLLSLNMVKTPLKMPHHVPVAWVREIGQGRLFYNNFGHTPSTWRDEKFLQHLVDGTRWALRLESGSAEPNPDVQAREYIRSFLAATARDTGRTLEQAQATYEKLANADRAWLVQMAQELADFRRMPVRTPKKGELLTDENAPEVQKRRAEMQRLTEVIEKRAGA